MGGQLSVSVAHATEVCMTCAWVACPQVCQDLQQLSWIRSDGNTAGWKVRRGVHVRQNSSETSQGACRFRACLEHAKCFLHSDWHRKEHAVDPKAYYVHQEGHDAKRYAGQVPCVPWVHVSQCCFAQLLLCEPQWRLTASWMLTSYIFMLRQNAH